MSGDFECQFPDSHLHDTTPAPLDPSKVKAGDTVTLTRGRARVEDTVYEITKRGEIETDNFDDPFSLDQDGWTLTDHQPATKPVWMPGDTGMATVSGKANVRVMRVLPDDRDPVTRPWVSDHPIGGWLAHTEPEVTDFVPDEPRPLPTRDQVIEAVEGHLFFTDRVMALLAGAR